jgi:hypothetical protein
MDLGRSLKFGAIGAVGVVLALLATVGLSWIVWADRITGAEGDATSTIGLVVIAGVAVAVVFLFVVIGGFVDRELAARERDD